MRNEIKNNSFLQRNKKSFSSSFETSQRKRSFKFILIGIVFLSFLIFVLIFLFFSNFFNIQKIEINQISSPNYETVENIVLKQKSNSFLLFSSENIFIFNEKKLLKSLAELNFMNISVNKKIIKRSLIITVEERQTSFIFSEANFYYMVDNLGNVVDYKWNCSAVPETEEGASTTDDFIEEPILECLDVNEEFKKENFYPIFENNGLARVSDDKKNIKLDPEYINFGLKLYNDLSENTSFGFKNIVLDEDYNTIKVKLINDLELYFNLKNDYLDQVTRFFTLKRELGAKLEDKKYIDLRYEDKIFYY